RGGDEALRGLVKDMAGGALTGAVAFAPGIAATPAPAAGGPGGGGPGALVIHGSCGPVAGARQAGLLILPAIADGQPASTGGHGVPGAGRPPPPPRPAPGARAPARGGGGPPPPGGPPPARPPPPPPRA